MHTIELRFVGLGVAAWLGFLIFIRLVGTAAFTIGNPLLPVLFVAAIPTLIGVIYALSYVTGVAIRDMPIPVMVMTFTALILDGLAIGFTDFYGDSHEQIRASAAFLLWGAGWGMLISMLLAARADSADNG